MVNRSRTAPSYNNQRHYLSDLPDQLRLYDEVIRAWLCQMQFDYGSREVPDIKSLRVVKASPERAFADIRKLLDSTFGEFEDEQEQTPLPIASFMRTDLTVDMSRFKSVTNRKMSRTGTSEFLTKDNAEVYNHRWPLPYSFSYQIDFWTRYESTLDSMRVWFALQFSPGGNYTYLPIDFTSIDRLYDVQNVFTLFGGISDTSDLEPGTEQRVERATASLDVQGWIFFPVEVAKTVLSGQIDFYEVPVTLSVDDPEADADENLIDTYSFDFTS